MENTLLSCEVANLHLIEIKQEVANQVKASKEARKKLVKTYYQTRESFLKNKPERRKYETNSLDEQLVFSINL